MSNRNPRNTFMKHNKILLLLAFIASQVGCDQQSSTSKQIDKIEAKTESASQDIKNYTYAQKAEFTDKMQAELADLNRDLDQLSAKIDASSDAVKADAKPKLQALRDQTAQLNKQLDEVRNATESTWDSVKNSFKKAYESSKDGFNQARQWVSDKIAP
jgi:chromosome segregation ATPase